MTLVLLGQLRDTMRSPCGIPCPGLSSSTRNRPWNDPAHQARLGSHTCRRSLAHIGALSRQLPSQFKSHEGLRRVRFSSCISTASSHGCGKDRDTQKKQFHALFMAGTRSGSVELFFPFPLGQQAGSARCLSHEDPKQNVQELSGAKPSPGNPAGIALGHSPEPWNLGWNTLQSCVL